MAVIVNLNENTTLERIISNSRFRGWRFLRIQPRYIDERTTDLVFGTEIRIADNHQQFQCSIVVCHDMATRASENETVLQDILNNIQHELDMHLERQIITIMQQHFGNDYIIDYDAGRRIQEERRSDWEELARPDWRGRFSQSFRNIRPQYIEEIVEDHGDSLLVNNEELNVTENVTKEESTFSDMLVKFNE